MALNHPIGGCVESGKRLARTYESTLPNRPRNYRPQGRPCSTIRWGVTHLMTRYTLLIGCLLLTGPAAAHAQMRWVVDSRSSLAWWQVSPNLNHLWATTCPGDSSWRPGEGR